MNSIIKEYFDLSDAMLQALTIRQYDVFLQILENRKRVVQTLENNDTVFGSMSTNEKKVIADKIKEFEHLLETEMKKYKSELDGELKKVLSEKAVVRQKSKIRGYYESANKDQGIFVDKLK